MSASERQRLGASVILCTHNPRRDVLRRTLDALACQTLPKSLWEVVLVDNASSPALSLDELDPTNSLGIRLAREARAGLIFARQRALAEIRSDLVVFVDDDNWLDPEYLAHAVRIAASQPELGAFAGIAEAVLEVPVAAGLESALCFLGNRNFGPEAMTSFEEHWGPWEPIGAGMVLRRVVAEAFVQWLDSDPRMRSLGRSGSNLRACDDSLIARCAYRLGLACSYQPSLKLRHFMKSDRLSEKYMRRLAHASGASYADLDEIQYGGRMPNATFWQRAKLIGWVARSVVHARRSYGKAWKIHASHSWGYFLRSVTTHGRLPDFERARRRQWERTRATAARRAA